MCLICGVPEYTSGLGFGLQVGDQIIMPLTAGTIAASLLHHYLEHHLLLSCHIQLVHSHYYLITTHTNYLHSMVTHTTAKCTPACVSQQKLVIRFTKSQIEAALARYPRYRGNAAQPVCSSENSGSPTLSCTHHHRMRLRTRLLPQVPGSINQHTCAASALS
ncbi:hypothetical protein BDQ17DRAFT_723985 [Cyathus striatus]|nr:hypothetical protein BDQ17DRAFT_723985 [Cyathus striatus]